MLTDSEIVALREDPEYVKLSCSTLDTVIADFATHEYSDFNPNVAFFVRAGIALARSYVIRKELS